MPGSRRSEVRGIRFIHLPAAGYRGPVPALPLPNVSDRESEVWAVLWRTPQAVQWAVEDWRTGTVALYCRWAVRAEDPAAPATVMGQVARLADQIGLTSVGLRQAGWVLDEPESNGALAQVREIGKPMPALERARLRAERAARERADREGSIVVADREAAAHG